LHGYSVKHHFVQIITWITINNCIKFVLPIETVPWIEGREDKGEQWKGWIQVWENLYIAKKLCKYDSVPPPRTIMKEK
jgi:hypothetical protein